MEPLEEAVPERLAQAEIDGVVSLPGVSRRTSARPSRSRDEVLEHVTVSMLAEGHILVEDYPGVGKTALGAGAPALDRLRVRACAVHRGTAAGRHRRLTDLQPAGGTLRVPPGSDLRQRRDRRRGQPRVAEDTVRPARVHAGAQRHRRRHVARPRAPVPRLRDPEPGRVRGHVPAARGAGRPLDGPGGSRWATPTPRPRPGCWRATSRATVCSTSSRSPTRAEIVDAVETAHRVHASRALRNYIVALLRRTRDDDRVESLRVPARGPDAPARSQGPRARARPRPRAARRRPGPRRSGPLPPPDARSRGRRPSSARRSSRTRSPQCGLCERHPPPTRRIPAAARRCPALAGTHVPPACSCPPGAGSDDRRSGRRSAGLAGGHASALGNRMRRARPAVAGRRGHIRR